MSRAAQAVAQLALLVAALGAQEEAAAAWARGPARRGEGALDASCLLQLVMEGGDGEGADHEMGLLKTALEGDLNHSSPGDFGAAPVAVLDLTQNDTALKGFLGGFSDGTFGYLAPLSNGVKFGKVARFNLANFGDIEVLDLAATDTNLRGFTAGFAHGTYGYMMPFYNTASNGRVVRFDLTGFVDVYVLNLGTIDPQLTGSWGGFKDGTGTHGYVVPYRYAGGYSGMVARFDLATFAAADVDALDLNDIDTDLRGFSSGFTFGDYGYLVPYSNENRFGKLARFDLATFKVVTVLDLAAHDTDLKGFWGSFSDGTWGYVLPFSNGSPFGKVVRFDLATFLTVAVLDLTITDTGLKGFWGGFSDGTYGYVIPYHNGDKFGKVARFDLGTFGDVAVLDLTTTDTDLTGFRGGFVDGAYGYAVPYDNCAAFGKVARFGVKAAADDGQSSVVGDPHVVNVEKVKFEIRAEGVHKLVQIPQFTHSNRTPDLRVDAVIQHLGSCDKSFMTSLSIFGRWTEDGLGLMRISHGSDMPNTTLLVNELDPEEFSRRYPLPGAEAGRLSLTFKLKDVGFRVAKHAEGRYGEQRSYLNVRITGLRKYRDLGGLLGFDSHEDAARPPANCTGPQPAAPGPSSLIGAGRSAPTTTDGGSRIEAA